MIFSPEPETTVKGTGVYGRAIIRNIPVSEDRHNTVVDYAGAWSMNVNMQQGHNVLVVDQEDQSSAEHSLNVTCRPPKRSSDSRLFHFVDAADQGYGSANLREKWSTESRKVAAGAQRQSSGTARRT